MNTDERFGQTLSAWLGQEAAHRVPDHLAEVLVQTAATRQRPRWSSLERLLPMQTTLRLSPVPRLGLLLLLGLAVLAALGITLFAVGSRNAFAPVAGLARNGPIAYDRDGDIYRYDPASGAQTLLVGGPDSDSQPLFSRDGSRFLFTRRQGGGSSAVMIANADGNHVRTVIDEPTGRTWTDWSPDGTKIAFGASTAGRPSVIVVNADGSGMTPLDVGMGASAPSWVGPDGSDILFRGEGPAGVGLFLVKADGTDAPRPVRGAPISADATYHEPVVSLDGTRVAFSSFERSTWQPATGERSPGWDGMIEAVHVLDLTTGTNVQIPPGTDPLVPSQPVDEFLPTLSPDGRMVVFKRDRSDGATWLGAAPSDGSAAGHAVGSDFASAAGEGPSYHVSPDGTLVIATYPGEAAARLLPIAGGPGSSVATSLSTIPSMQRLAP